MKKLILILSVSIFTFTSCSSDDDSTSINEDDTNPIEVVNKFVFNNIEYTIDNAISYTEANDSSIDFYYFDISFLTSNVNIGTTEDFTGNGSLFNLTFINETNTFLNDGEYAYSTTIAEDFFDLDDPWIFIDYDFGPSQGDFDYDFSLQDGFYDQFESATFTITREANVYTIIGSGIVSNGIPFSLQFTGTLEVDPDSE